MHKNFFIFLILFLLIISTSLVLIFRPKTHKHIAFENRNFKLEMISQSAKVDIPKAEVDIEIGAPEINIETPVINVKVETPKVNVTTTPVKTTPKPTEKTVQTKPSQTQKTTNNSTQKNNSSTTKKNDNNTNTTKTQQTKQNEQTQPIKTAAQPKKQTQSEQTKKEVVNTSKNEQVTVKEPKVEVTKPVAKTQQKQLTQEELEIIAWNKWRSDLQNQLMRDSKISAPIGTRFMFSFTVDKFGTITNLKTWSSNPSYTPTAVRVIKPILLSYQGKAILNFPANSKRITTNVDGGFTMAYSSNYSKPSDYNDYERVKK